MRKKAKTNEPTEDEQPAVLQKLLTVADVSALLCLSRVKVYDLMKTDGLPTLKIKGARRIQPDKLQRWIEQHYE
jgi:excisionase family DNA binding protein